MRLLSANVGRELPVRNAKKSGKTGIFKRPVGAPVEVTFGGLVGDAISDTENHGGADQAVYVYGAPDYDWWSEELGRELRPGAFGENLTVAGLESARMRIGDRLRTGSVLLEVTAPRIPCVTLATRMGDPSFVKRFRWAERPGVYCRVIKEGRVLPGDPVTVEGSASETMSVIEMFAHFFRPDPSEAAIRRHLPPHVALRARVAKERQLEELLSRKVSAADV